MKGTMASEDERVGIFQLPLVQVIGVGTYFQLNASKSPQFSHSNASRNSSGWPASRPFV